MASIMKPETLDDVLNTYRQHGHLQYGEDVTELEHALQCAALAQRAGEPPMIVIAALLHDYGHLCHQLDEDAAARGIDAKHEEIGYAMLKHLFVREIVDAGRLHVAAKRYLCRVEPAYEAALSEASRLSLRLQGGPMNLDEADAFEKEPHFGIAVQVRRYDDMGKIIGLITPDLDSYRDGLESFLTGGPGGLS
jgi:phosphonate degradation associated HDIG domain protein